MIYLKKANRGIDFIILNRLCSIYLILNNYPEEREGGKS